MVMVHDTREVAEVLAAAVEHDTPVIARGAGSGMTGGSVPERGGIIVNTEAMNHIIRLLTKTASHIFSPAL